jgi:hypothetical protein
MKYLWACPADLQNHCFEDTIMTCIGVVMARTVFAFIFVHLLARKPNLEEKKSMYSSELFHNFHLSESSFTSLRLQQVA